VILKSGLQGLQPCGMDGCARGKFRSSHVRADRPLLTASAGVDFTRQGRQNKHGCSPFYPIALSSLGKEQRGVRVGGQRECGWRHLRWQRPRAGRAGSSSEGYRPAHLISRRLRPSPACPSPPGPQLILARPTRRSCAALHGCTVGTAAVAATPVLHEQRRLQALHKLFPETQLHRV
jgi:hypothetical protein